MEPKFTNNQLNADNPAVNKKAWSTPIFNIISKGYVEGGNIQGDLESNHTHGAPYTPNSHGAS